MVERHKVKITVLKRFHPSEVKLHPSPATHVEPFGPCELFHEGQEFIIESSPRGLTIPRGFCTSAWQSFYDNMRTLMFGGNVPAYKENGITINCCIDGLRPVIFKLERI